MNRLLKIIYVATFIIILHSTSVAQVTIAPTNLFIDDNSRFGTYLVVNGSNQPQEISIDFIFGYSKYEDSGKRVLVYDDEEAKASYSAADWVRAFPKNFTLGPGQRQVVRLRVSAPRDIEDGTYWSRIKTASSAVATPVEVQSNDNVTASVGFKIEQVTGLYYKKGSVSTGITINEIATSIDSEGVLDIEADLLRTGNSPFLGSIITRIYDGSNTLVKDNFIATTVFFDGIHKQTLDISALEAGDYTLELSFESQRNDISDSDIVKMDTSTKTVSFKKN